MAYGAIWRNAANNATRTASRCSPTPHLRGLEGDLQPRAGGLGKAAERVHGGIGAAAFEAGDGLLRRPHPASHVRLRQPCTAARVDECAGERKFLLQCTVFVHIFRISAPLREQLFDRNHFALHLTSFALALAIARARAGVFSVFLMKVCSTTTR